MHSLSEVAFPVAKIKEVVVSQRVKALHSTGYTPGAVTVYWLAVQLPEHVLSEVAVGGSNSCCPLVQTVRKEHVRSEAYEGAEYSYMYFPHVVNVSH
jgi:hypothetical protein